MPSVVDDVLTQPKSDAIQVVLREVIVSIGDSMGTRVSEEDDDDPAQLKAWTVTR